MRQIPVIVISLSRSVDRRALVSRQLDAMGVSYDFFNAIDGRSSGIKAHGYYRPLLEGEIGCAESHLEVIKLIATGRDDYVCVLEDDVALTQEYPTALDETWLRGLGDFDVLRLITNQRAQSLAIKVAPHVFTLLRPFDGMAAQIYSRAGANKIAIVTHKICSPIDAWLYQEARVSGLRILEVRPSPVGYSNLPSLIGDRSLRELRPLWQRFVYRVWIETRTFVSFIRAWGVGALFRLQSIRSSKS